MKFPHLPVSDNAGITRNFEHLQGVLTKGVQRGASLPGSPRDGQEYDYVADATNGVIWRFRYRAASASTHKWEFVGGSALYTRTAAAVTTESEPYVALAGGPSLAAPLAGDYEIYLAAQINVTGKGSFGLASIKFSAAGPEDSDSIFTFASVEGSAGMGSRTTTKTGITTGRVIELQYRVAGPISKIEPQRRELSIRPVRVG